MNQEGDPGADTSIGSQSPESSRAQIIEEIRDRAETVWTRGSDAGPSVAKVVSHTNRGIGGRVAIVDGCRTPFSKAGTDLRDMDVVDLSGGVVAELVSRAELDPEEIDLSIFGVVVAALHAPNLGREVERRFP